VGAADDDVGAAGQGFSEGVIGFSTHHERFSECGAFEMFEVFGNVPDEGVVFTDDAVLGHGGDGCEFDFCHGT